MTRAKMQAALESVKAAMHTQFPEHRERLEQLDDHLATVAMVVDHIHDEAARAAVGG